MKNIIIGNANGNTFVIIKNNDYKITSKLIKKICCEYNTDALIHLNDLNLNTLSMDYYNNDGTWETLCLNGLTCVGLILKSNFKNRSLIVKCGPKKYKLKILESENIEIELPKPEYKSEKIKFDNYEGYYIDSGAKHFIVNIDSDWPEHSDLIKISQKIRYDFNKFPEGINVNFYKIINDTTIEVITYEKGVEKLMDSCASGSYASAFHFHTKQNEIFIINKGGNFSFKFEKYYKKNYLINTGHIAYINK